MSLQSQHSQLAHLKNGARRLLKTMTKSKMSGGLGAVIASSFREQRGLLSLAGHCWCTGTGLVMSLVSALGTKAPIGCTMGCILDGILTLDLTRYSPK